MYNTVEYIFERDFVNVVKLRKQYMSVLYASVLLFFIFFLSVLLSTLNFITTLSNYCTYRALWIHEAIAACPDPQTTFTLTML